MYSIYVPEVSTGLVWQRDNLSIGLCSSHAVLHINIGGHYDLY